ncbi:MAG TPA: hypothetical protein VK841_12655 [Polyangiaceae bacterium]|jgi:hypothetical protein|nr:hypothetical protein [Polyangiaceae bacterium]
MSCAAHVPCLAIVMIAGLATACRGAPSVQNGASPANDAGTSKKDDAAVTFKPTPRVFVDGIDCRNKGEPVDWTRATLLEPNPDDFHFHGPRAHSFLLPHSLPPCDPPRWNGGGPPPCAAGLAPGEEPGPAFPAGTVYLANWADDDAASVWEWDLARAVVRRRLELHLPDDQCAMILRRSGTVLHLLTNPAAGGPGFYARISSDLGSFVISPAFDLRTGGPDGFIANETMAAIFFSDEIDSKYGFIAETFDARARKIARRFLPASGPSDAVIFQGHLYALLDRVNRDHLAFELLRLGRDLSIERQSVVALKQLTIEYPDYASASIFVSHNRLFATDRGNPQVMEISPEGKVSGLLDRCVTPDLRGDAVETWVGRTHVVAYGSSAVEWSDSEEERPPLPCPDVP